MQIVEWIEYQRSLVEVRIEHIPFAELSKWTFSQSKGIIKHDSGGFFTIEGIEVKTSFGEKKRWDQPIINQAEIGYLGFIVRKFQDGYKFLVQAKIEPGNINYVQLSPTIQATKSNFTQVHGGRKPDYLDYFANPNKKIVVDQLQSEQSERFIKKRNRNIIIEVEDKVEDKENFIWLTLAEIKDALKLDNVLNMDSRTVISNLNYSLLNKFYNNEMNNENNFTKSLTSMNSQLYTFAELKSWLTELKFKYDLSIRSKKLTDLRDWEITDYEIRSKLHKFKVIGADITISNREVAHWTQPLMEAVEEGIFAFIVSNINGVLHFLVQAKLESGCLDKFELAPTIQCYESEITTPYLDILKSNKHKIIHDSWQSEEGGRFFREQNRNMIIEIKDYRECQPLSENYRWMTLNQLYRFMEFNNYVNIQARSILATIDYR
ncbi:NDP-hexose 2,3-dehydratase family protein [bacterium]|nr:NDP-hexose 2,3-dehydratase family protein [bacterium]